MHHHHKDEQLGQDLTSAEKSSPFDDGEEIEDPSMMDNSTNIFMHSAEITHESAGDQHNVPYPQLQR